MRLQDKTALITGGASGIGLAIARRFLAEGARVAITGRNRAALDAAVAGLGGEVLAIEADTTDAAATERAVAATVEKFGPIDVLVPNAGIGAPTPLDAADAGTFDAILRTNVTGVFFTIQAALPHLAAGASVVLIGSTAGAIGFPGFAAYAASKGAVRALSRAVAAELAPRGIRVNVVSPGAIRTPIWSGVAPSSDDRTALEALQARAIPQGRIGDPDEVANAVLFFASPESAHVQAAELFVDGGLTGTPMGAPIYRIA